MKGIFKMKKPIVLAILDGVGLRDEIHGNAFKQANTPFIDSLFNICISFFIPRSPTGDENAASM